MGKTSRLTSKTLVTFNEKGEKTGVLLKLSDYEQLVEDLHDLAAVAERREEDTISHEEFLARISHGFPTTTCCTAL